MHLFDKITHRHRDQTALPAVSPRPATPSEVPDFEPYESAWFYLVEQRNDFKLGDVYQSVECLEKILNTPKVMEEETSTETMMDYGLTFADDDPGDSDDCWTGRTYVTCIQ
jgi:hypothetical protein